MDASDTQLSDGGKEQAVQDEAPGSSNGTEAGDETGQPLLPRTRIVQHKLHAATSQSHSKHHSHLSAASLSSPPPSTALTPASSAASLVQQLASQLSQLHSHSQAAIHTLRFTAASPSLLPAFQSGLDAYRSDFAAAASSLSSPIQRLSSQYSDRLEGAADECRSLSYRVSNSLSQLSSSAAGTASGRIHTVYASYRSLQRECDNCQLLAAVATQLSTVLRQLQGVKRAVSEKMAWQYMLDGLRAVREGSEQLLAFDPHMAASVVYRRLMDEHDKIRSDMEAAAMNEIWRLVRFLHFSRAKDVRAGSTQLPEELPSALLDPADPATPYTDITDSDHQPSASSALVLLWPNVSVRLTMLLHVCKELSLTSALSAHVQTVIERWFSAVIALIGASGYGCRLASRYGQGEPCSAASVQLSHSEERSGGQTYPLFDVLESMAAFCSTAGLRLGQSEDARRALLHSTILPLVVDRLLPLTIPNSVTDLLSYGTVTQRVQRMYAQMLSDTSPQSPHAVPSSEPLSLWCADIDKHFLRSVRLLALDRCRELLINNDYQVYNPDQSNSLVSALSSYPPLFFPTSTSPYLSNRAAANGSSLTPTPEPVSASLVQLLPARLQARVLSSYLASHSPVSLHACLYSLTLFDVLGQCMHAYSASSELCSSLVSTLCDCIVLVLSIPGVYNSDQLSSIGYMSWLYASDCSFLAVCVERMASFVVTESRLASVSSASFFPSISGKAPPAAFASEVAVRLLALVEPLRAVSDHWKRHTLTQLTSAVLSSLDTLPPFTALDSPATLRTALSDLQQTVHTLTRSLRSLRDVQRPAARQSIARHLTDRLAHTLSSRVLAVHDVGIDEARGMESVLVLVNCAEVRELVGVGWDGLGWRRLEAVQLLIGSEQTLVKIEAEWDAGMLSALDSAEVCGWIRALYQDSANRQRLLQKIGGGRK